MISSTSHLRYKLEKDRMRDPNLLVGHGHSSYNTILKKSNLKYIFTPPNFNFYEKLCLPLSLIWGYHHEIYLHSVFCKKEQLPFKKEYENAAEFYKKVKILKSNSKNEAACNYLRQKWLHICADVNLSPNGPFKLQECIDILADYFGMNVYVLESVNFTIYYKYPESYNENLPAVFLLLSENHVDFIMNRFKAFDKLGSPCIFCKKVVKKMAKHRCYNTNVCFVCNRLKVDLLDKFEYPFVTTNNKNFYCIKKYSAANTVCNKCGLNCRSQDCHKKHKAVSQCGLKRKCALCKRVYIKKYDHACDKKFCIRCKNNYDSTKPHFCIMLPQQKCEDICALAVYDCETVQDNGHNSCYKCFYKEKDYLQAVNKGRSNLSEKEKLHLLCEDHKDSDLEEKQYHNINFISVLVEHKHGYFNLVQLADPKLDYEEDMKVIENYKIIPKKDYYLKEKYGKIITRKKYNKRHRSRDIGSSVNKFPLILRNSGAHPGGEIFIGKKFEDGQLDYIRKNFSAVEKFLIFFIREEFRNTSFIGKFN